MDNRENKGSLILPMHWVELILGMRDAPAGELFKALCLKCTGVVAEPENITSRGVYRLMALGGLHTDIAPSTGYMEGEQLPTHNTGEQGATADHS